jgi:hypothetical protein
VLLTFEEALSTNDFEFIACCMSEQAAYASLLVLKPPMLFVFFYQWVEEFRI